MEFGDSSKDHGSPNRFNLSPSKKTLLKRNIATFSAELRKYTEDGRNLSSEGISRSEGGVKKPDESDIMENQNVVSASLSEFHHLNFNENSMQVLGEMDEMNSSLIHQTEELERQVKERRDWAHQKVMQAANKVSNDSIELKILRLDMEETRKLKNDKQLKEGSRLERLVYEYEKMKIVVEKTSGLIDRGNLIKKKIEKENDELRAEIEAYKLRASEYEITELEALKKEKKCLKKLKVWEKQKKKLQDSIAAEKQMIFDLKQQLVESEKTEKEAEAMWKQEQRAKAEALSLLKEETRLNEEVKATNKRMLMDMRLSSEIESQQYKDELERLHQELTRLKASNEAPERDIAKLLHEFDTLEVSSSKKGASNDRRCVICKKGEVSVVFLPCAHQVICANCNDNYGNNEQAKCPSCLVPIERRIRIFGAAS
ncbi:hypothetical protein EJD97_018421 [Solanum chilense]|uniref:RING-type domain-containing protein n=1 Tax=Solanum chilense TaxID=4083 RepID=A0A6N2B155_SOLCI|nr:hypothetical protein EJD97_018421 [Solanum chilense]